MARLVQQTCRSLSKRCLGSARTALVTVLLALASATTTQAQDATWLTTPGSNDWSTGTNWSLATAPTGTAFFGASSTTSLAITGAATVGTLQFNAAAPAYAFTINPSVTFNINGAGIVNNSASVPTFTNNGGGLNFLNASTAGNATIINTLGLYFRDSSRAGTANITSSWSMNFRGSSTADGANIVNTAGLYFYDTSTAGNATITTTNSALTMFQGTSSGGLARFITQTGGQFDISPLSSSGMSVGSIEGEGTYFLGGSTLTVGGNGLSTMVRGTITDGGDSGGSGARLVKTGTGTLTLTGSNAYNGGTTLSAGTLAVGHNKALGNGALAMASGTTLQAAANGRTLANPIALVGGVSTIDTQGNALTLSGIMSGAGSVTKVGNGTLALSGANIYSGGTTVLTGTLEIQNASALGTGGVTLNGGHLRSNIAGTATLPNPLSLVHGSVISAASGQTVNIDLANVADGAIVLLGSSTDTGTLVATGASITMAGSATVEVNGGTVRAGGSQLAGLMAAANRVTIARNATLDLAGFGATLRDLWGEGTLTGSSGTLQMASGEFAGGIGGNVALEKVSSDPLNLSGTHTYTGPTTVREGFLGVNGSLTSAVTVLNGGALGGSGRIGGLSVQSGGFVKPGNSIGTLTVAGNVAFGPGSFYAVEIDGAGQSDRIAATGAASLTGGTVTILPDAGVNFVADTPYTILTASGGVTGTFAALQSSEFAFISPTLGYATDAVTLTMVRKTEQPPAPQPPAPQPPAPRPLAFHSVAVTKNQYRTADAIEALRAGNRLYNTVLGASVAGARQAFDALSGEAHAGAVTAAYGDARLVETALLARLRQPLIGSSVPLLAQGPYPAAFAADRPGTAPQPVALAPVEPRYALWGEGFGAWGRRRSDGNAASLATATGGFLLGADALVSDGLRLGLAGGFTRTRFDVDARLSSGTSESVVGALYGTGSWGDLNLRLGAAYARHDIATRRSIAFPGFADAVSAAYDGSTLQAFGEIGYRIGLGAAALEPFAGASVLRLDTDRFQETGGAAALTGFGQRFDLATTTVGLRGAAQIGDQGPLTLRGLLGWRHAYGDVAPAALLAFAGGTSPFAVAGVPLDRDALVAEAGLAWQAADRLSLGLSYSGQIGRRAQDHTLKANLLWTFNTH